MNDRRIHGPAPARFDLLRAESFVRGEAMLALQIDEPAASVCRRFDRLAADAGYQVLARNDLAMQLRMAGAQAAAPSVLVVFDLEWPGLLARLLAADPAMAHVLPTRVVVHDAHAATTVITPRPSATWPALSHATEVLRISRQLEGALWRLLRSLRQSGT